VNYASFTFLIFFLLVFGLYYSARTATVQIGVLIVSSMVFYAWQSAPLLGVFVCAWLVTGLASYGVSRAETRSRAKLFAFLGGVVNLCLLGFFKYKFLWLGSVEQQGVNTSASLGEWLLLAPLPIGISFYTFHGISLVVDVYRKTYVFVSPTRSRAEAIRHLGRTLLYLVFFPQLIAGPIIKARDFFPQVAPKRLADIDFVLCFRTLILGFFLKSVIADSLAEQTAWMAYPYFERKSSFELVLMLYGYSAQIFADFAGYSLIALGLAGLLGYKLPDNFNFPYLSGSIAEFWRRWHISLSSWLRDYLYIPLGGNRKGVLRTNINLIVVMLLGGLWHGAAWSFALWGLWHGAGLAIERPWLSSRFMTSDHILLRGLRIFIVFNFVSLGWLFFRLQDISQAAKYFQLMLHSEVSGMGMTSVFLICLYGSVIAAYHLLHVYRSRLSPKLRNVLYGVMLFLIVTNSGPVSPFIYFQF
jgi:alginate O-acetyltransferase complex protein AlgI